MSTLQDVPFMEFPGGPVVNIPGASALTRVQSWPGNWDPIATQCGQKDEILFIPAPYMEGRRKEG